MSFFSEPLIGSHDHKRFEIFCYADVHNGDAATERFRGLADVWRDTTALSDEQIAQRVRDDGLTY